MKKKDIKGSGLEDLKKNLKDFQRQLVNLRAENAQARLKNVKSLNLKRKEIAQIKTFIRLKELENAG